MKVLLGLSGGVDSAIAAYLLKEQGYDVTCCFMRNWDSLINNDLLGNPDINNDICPQEKDYNDALQVAKQLGLELKRIDFVKEYWDNVFNNFITEYKHGRTPNPDILCNKYIKFDSFLNYALKEGYDMIATGHYAKVVHQKDGSFLLRSVDTNKDQTYFLAQISQLALSKTLFPLGDVTKPQVREIAEKLDLVIAKKKDSTGICFIGERNFRKFLQNYIPAQDGVIKDVVTNEIVGQHVGVMYYTNGQRKGLNLGGCTTPYYVCGKDVDKNILYVANVEHDIWLKSDKCLVKGVNWFNKPIDNNFSCSAKFRYRGLDYDVHVEIIDEDSIELSYPQLVENVTIGQQAVIYNDQFCLGGGVIDQVYLNNLNFEERRKNYEEKCA
ncbi:MAG: tRNA 2-thiouridine(34) synthase MnmA [Erysipelotrichaceae bacterium]